MCYKPVSIKCYIWTLKRINVLNEFRDIVMLFSWNNTVMMVVVNMFTTTKLFHLYLNRSLTYSWNKCCYGHVCYGLMPCSIQVYWADYLIELWQKTQHNCRYIIVTLFLLYTVRTMRLKVIIPTSAHGIMVISHSHLLSNVRD